MLLLFPAAVLIVMVLAAIAVDSSIAFLGQREMTNAVAAAANDAAGLGVGNRAFYQGGQVVLDPGTAQQVALERVRAALDPGRFAQLQVDVSVVPALAPSCPLTVRVVASARVEYLFAKAIPGAPHTTRVAATSVAGPARDDVAGC